MYENLQKFTWFCLITVLQKMDLNNREGLVAAIHREQEAEFVLRILGAYRERGATHQQFYRK